MATWKEQHPRLVAVGRGIYRAYRYVAYGELLVAVGQWLILLSARIAETVMMFCVLWITADFVAPEFVGGIATFIAGQGATTTLNNLSLIALSLLPEIILYSAVVTTLKYGLAIWRRPREERLGNIAWTILYGLPTLSFLALTLYTIGSFVEHQGHLNASITGLPLVIRCLTGWFYSFVNLVRANMKHVESDQPEDQEKTDKGPETSPESGPVAGPSMAIQIDYTTIANEVVDILQGRFPAPVASPEIDYKRLARELAVLLPPTITEEKPEKPARIAAQSTAKEPAREPEIDDQEARLAAAYNRLKVAGKRTSARSMAEAARPCSRGTAAAWLAVHDPDYNRLPGRSEGQEEDQGQGVNVVVASTLEGHDQGQGTGPDTGELETITGPELAFSA